MTAVHAAFQFRRERDGELLAAGAITANTCNGNAAFTGNYTVDGCPPSEPLHHSADRRQHRARHDRHRQSRGRYGTTTIALPFSYTLYDQTFT